MRDACTYTTRLVAKPNAKTSEQTPLRYESAKSFALEAARLAANTRCTNVVVLDVSGLSPVTDFFVIATGTSPRQMRTVIDQIKDPLGQTITAGYDSTSGNFTSLTWQDATTKTFVYDSPNANQSWALTGVIDEANKRYATFTYDPAGWAKSTQLAGGVYKYEASYDTPPQPVIREVYDQANSVVWRYHEWSAPVGTKVSQPNGSILGMAAKTISAGGATGVNGGNLLRFGGYSQPAASGCSC